MTTPNPMKHTFSDLPPDQTSPTISKRTVPIAGIQTDVYGLDELPFDTETVQCIWLLHPRLLDRTCMEPLATYIVRSWYASSGNNHASPEGKRSSSTETSSRRKARRSREKGGILALALDHRNHGTRLISPLANEAWKAGNPTHAQDMFATFRGTAMDVSMLISYLPCYIQPERRHADRGWTIDDAAHTVLGVSLGAHAAWHCVLHDERVRSAVVIVGCTDYIRVMRDRAQHSKLANIGDGSEFLGSSHFPPALVEEVKRWDPAAFLAGGCGGSLLRDSHGHGKGDGKAAVLHQPSPAEIDALLPRMRKAIGGKRILNLAGGADKLVPYAASKPFLDWLKVAAEEPGGWFAGNELVLRDRVFEGIGHAMSPGMREEMVRFLFEGDTKGASKI